jgi:hypothetical protein
MCVLLEPLSVDSTVSINIDDLFLLPFVRDDISTSVNRVCRQKLPHPTPPIKSGQGVELN